VKGGREGVGVAWLRTTPWTAWCLVGEEEEEKEEEKGQRLGSTMEEEIKA
jgi:hypothetical protein